MPEPQTQAQANLQPDTHLDPHAQTQMRTQVEGILRGANLPDESAAQAWDAFWASDQPDSFRSGLNGVEKLPGNIKLQLMQLRFPEAASRVPQPRAEQPVASQPPAAPQLIPGASPGSEHRPKDLPPLPAEYRPNASGFFSALTTPLTEQFGISPRDAVAKRNRATEITHPEWYRKLGHGAEEASLGAVEQLSAPLSILMAPVGAIAEGAGVVPGAVRSGMKGLSLLGGVAATSDAAGDIYQFFKTGDASKLGKAAVEIPLAGFGFHAGLRQNASAPKGKSPRVEISGEADAVTPPDQKSLFPAGLPEGSPTPKRIGSGAQQRLLEGPSQQKDAIEAIARTSGPFKSQVYEWSRKPLGEIAKLRQNALDAFGAVQRQASAETAPFPEGPTPVSNLSKNVPGTATGSRVPTGKGDFTPGGRRVLEDRARAQYEALDKLFRMKAEEAGLVLPEFPTQAGGRPSREALGGRREIAGPTPPPKPPAGLLPGPSGPYGPPPGAELYYQSPTPGMDYRFPVQAGKAPLSRQLAEPELRVFSPEATLDQNVETARSLPPEVLERNIEQMRLAAAEHASQMLKAAGKDQDKLADVKAFIGQAKERLDRFQGVYDELSGAKSKPAPAPSRKLEAVKPNGKPQAQAEEAPTPESVGKKLVPGVRREAMKSKAAGKDAPPASKAMKGLEESEKPTPTKGKGPKVQEIPKAAAKPVSKVVHGEGAHREGANPPRPEPEIDTAEAGTIAQHLGDQINAAKSTGLKIMRLTIPRGEGKKPLVIGVNPEIDTPEELAATIVRSGGASGMATMESTDPERPVSWKFLIGEPPAPPRPK